MPTRLGQVAKNFRGNDLADNGTQDMGLYARYRRLLRNSPWRWLIVIGSVLYLCSPIDLIPDFIPFVGLVDDGVVACILLHELCLMGLDFYEERKRKKLEAQEPLLPTHTAKYENRDPKIYGESMYTTKSPAPSGRTSPSTNAYGKPSYILTG